jgi:hypothetical protein
VPLAGEEPILRHAVDNGLGLVLASFPDERLLGAIFLRTSAKPLQAFMLATWMVVRCIIRIICYIITQYWNSLKKE